MVDLDELICVLSTSSRPNNACSIKTTQLARQSNSIRSEWNIGLAHRIISRKSSSFKKTEISSLLLNVSLFWASSLSSRLPYFLATL